MTEKGREGCVKASHHQRSLELCLIGEWEPAEDFLGVIPLGEGAGIDSPMFLHPWFGLLRAFIHWLFLLSLGSAERAPKVREGAFLSQSQGAPGSSVCQMCECSQGSVAGCDRAPAGVRAVLPLREF